MVEGNLFPRQEKVRCLAVAGGTRWAWEVAGRGWEIGTFAARVAICQARFMRTATRAGLRHREILITRPIKRTGADERRP